MLILKYLPRSRERGQRDENGNSLIDFHGPVELWERYSGTSEIYQIRVYVDTKDGTYLSSGPMSRKDAYQLFNSCCKLIGNLPEDHPLNHFLSPHSFLPPPKQPLDIRFLP